MKNSTKQEVPIKEQTNLYKENENMENGITTGGYVANAMYDNIRGFGYGYGSGPFASPTSNAVRINRNKDLATAGIDRVALTLDNAQEERRHTNLCNRISDMEFRLADRDRDITKDITDARFEAKDCCCETQKEILNLRADTNLRFAEVARQACEDKSQIIAEIKAVETRTLERELNRAERREQTQTILSTCGCGCGGGVRPCPPQ